MKNVYDIIKRPVITEQSMESVADKKYVFMVDVNSNKTEIKAAVEEVFGVKVAKVNTIRMQGKTHNAPRHDRNVDLVKRLNIAEALAQSSAFKACFHFCPPLRRLQAAL